jgi:hypothetical protein
MSLLALIVDNKNKLFLVDSLQQENLESELYASYDRN